ncbi:6-bladed beta-propeller [Parapedobacter sp. GCM10030251]|uniref:6-bladed beta-propeller n=1 Tax=Parapedobacter sp. GCM10030251 TaxID=3273419 RepID=UPI003616F0F7
MMLLKMYVVVSVLILFCLSSCNNNNSVDKNVKEIKFDLVDKELRLTHFVDSIQYFKIAEPEGVFFSNEVDFILSRNYMLINDWGTQKLHLLTINGKYLCEIGQIGRAEFEYGSLSACALDEDEELVFVVDNSSQRLLQYDFSGSHIRSIPLNVVAPLFIRVLENKKLLLFTQPGPLDELLDYPNIYVISYDGQEFVKKHLIAPKKNNQYRAASLFPAEEGYGIHMDCNDTIFYFTTDKGYFPGYVKKHKQLRPVDNPGLNVDRRPYLDILHPVVESSNFIFFNAALDRRWKGLVYDKGSDECFNLSYRGDFLKGNYMENDYDFGYPFWPNGQIDKKTLYQLVDPKAFLTYAKQIREQNFQAAHRKEGMDRRKDEFELFTDLVDENDFRVLVIAHFKY